MKKQELVWVKWTGEERPLIAYKKEVGKCGKIVDGPEMTMEEIADFCDLNAESCNAHEFVGAHRILSAILFRESRELATRIIKTIAEHGGLHKMTGNFSRTGSNNCFAEFGICEPWNDWKLKE